MRQPHDNDAQQNHNAGINKERDREQHGRRINDRQRHLAIISHEHPRAAFPSDESNDDRCCKADRCHAPAVMNINACNCPGCQSQCLEPSRPLDDLLPLVRAKCSLRFKAGELPLVMLFAEGAKAGTRARAASLKTTVESGVTFQHSSPKATGDRFYKKMLPAT